MKYSKQLHQGYLLIAVMLTSFGFAQPALAICVQSDPPADTVLAIDANNGCSDIQGQFGCSIKDPTNPNPSVATCTYTAPSGDWFTVNSVYNADGSLSWQLDPASTLTGYDTAIVGGGAKGKNNCGYIFKYDVQAGSGADCKLFDTDGVTCLSYQNITRLDICTDLVDEQAPPPPPEPVVAKPLQYCQQPGSTELGRIDETGIECPLMVDENGNCLETDENGNCRQKPVIVCNLEKDKYAWGTAGSDVEGGQEQVCCQCGITNTQTACFVSDDPDANVEECAPVLTSDPSQDVVLTFQKDGDDPCYTKYSGGKPYKVCW